MRNNAREAVYKLLFSIQFNGEFDEEFKNYIFNEENLTKDDTVFANELIDNYLKNQDKINETISSLAKGYEFDRIYSTDKCALQIAITEMAYIDSIPLVASISEAMELVRKFSTKDSPNFVNGILAEYKRQLESK
jgi:N utilization substance protein B